VSGPKPSWNWAGEFRNLAKAYLIDANVFVQAKNLHYRFEFCGGFWNWIEAAHDAGLVYSVAKVRAELIAGRKGDAARTWAEQLPGSFFLEDAGDPKVMAHYATLMAWATSGGQYTAAAINQFADDKNADAFIVAAARERGDFVVSHEKSIPAAKSRIPLPNAADAIGVKTMTIFDLLSKHAASTFVFKP